MSHSHNNHNNNKVRHNGLLLQSDGCTGLHFNISNGGAEFSTDAPHRPLWHVHKHEPFMLALFNVLLRKQTHDNFALFGLKLGICRKKCTDAVDGMRLPSPHPKQAAKQRQNLVAAWILNC